jgi:hypothetical protein
VGSLEDSKTQYLAVLKSIESKHGKQAALVTQALASLTFSNDTTNHILAELRVAGVLTDDSIATVEALQADAQSRTQRTMIGPLLAGLDEADAAVLAGLIKSAAKYLASLPLTAPACH